MRGYAEEFDHLHRACRLWRDVGNGAQTAAGDQVELWQRASDSAWSAGEYLLAVHLREEAVALTVGDPIRAVRLRLRLPWWQAVCSEEVFSAESTRVTLKLAEEHCPGTAEHVQALARHAHAEMWEQDAAARSHAVAAVRMARRFGSAEALAWALCASTETDTSVRSLDDAAKARVLARDIGDPDLLGWAARASANRLVAFGRDAEAAEVLLTTFRLLLVAGSVHDAMYANPAFAALILVDFGRWDEAREVLRLTLTYRLVAGVGAMARGAASLLAFRSGAWAAGRAHLTRARELQPRTYRSGHS